MLYKCRETGCQGFGTNSKMVLVEHSQVKHNREYSMEFLIGIKCKDVLMKKRVYARAKSSQSNLSLDKNNDGLYKEPENMT